MKILALCGVIKKQSGIKRTLGLAVDLARGAGAEVETAELRDFDMPLFDEDYDFKNSHPEGAKALTRKFLEADGFVIASPEYNLSIPGPLKNAIDWLSTAKPQPFRGKSAFLLSASPSMSGGNRGLWHLRVPLEYLGSHVYPGMFSLAQSHLAFDESGRLRDPIIAKLLEDDIRDFVRVTGALAIKEQLAPSPPVVLSGTEGA